VPSLTGSLPIGDDATFARHRSPVALRGTALCTEPRHKLVTSSTYCVQTPVGPGEGRCGGALHRRASIRRECASEA
jgi:hypothetical protein